MTAIQTVLCFMLEYVLILSVILKYKFSLSGNYSTSL